MASNPPSKSRRFRVVLTGLTAEKNKYAVIKTIAAHLNLPFAEAREIVEKTPSEIVSGIPEEAADLLEERLTQAGAIIEVLPDDIEGIHYCEIHPNIQARGTCRVCNRYICGPCILSAGKDRICVDCLLVEQRRRRLRIIRQVTLAFLGLLTLLYAANILFNRVEYLAGKYTLRILIVELVPSWNEAFQDRIAELNAPEGEGSGYALLDIDDWFQQQFVHFNPTRKHFPFLRVELSGPFLVEREPPEISPGAGPISRFFQHRKVARYLEALARTHDLDLDRYDMKIFLHFQDRLTPVRPESVEETSFDNMAIVYYPVHTAAPAHYVMEILQEIGRQLGASRKYTITSGRTSIYPFGYVAPFQKPLYPQSHAELMSGTIPIQRGVETQISTLDQLRIGHATAYEFGWISKADYERYYHLP
ncbi:MAG: hypothetical protein D6795_13770 [Deltaproteobacteria bacterium]|nr:MAG: hypothetical protein D6795_13770 [Deltaproteobacteria bacterium]